VETNIDKLPLIEKRIVNGYKKEMDTRQVVADKVLNEMTKDTSSMLDSRIQMTNRKIEEFKVKANESAVGHMTRL